MGVAWAILSEWCVWWPAALSTFVSVGNATQPFTRMLEAVGRLVSQLPQPVVIQRGHTPFENPNCEVLDFVGMERFEALVSSADLLIFHAGAGSVIHAVRAGKIPVVMPRLARYGEHVDDHQVEFAEMLAGQGKVILARDASDLEVAVAQARALGSRPAGTEPPRMLGMVAAELAHQAQVLAKKR